LVLTSGDKLPSKGFASRTFWHGKPCGINFLPQNAIQTKLKLVPNFIFLLVLMKNFDIILLMFFKKKIKNQKIILFDFRSSSIACAIMSFNPIKDNFEIIFADREHYFFNEKPNNTDFIETAHNILKKLLQKINHFKISDKNIAHEISSIHILWGAPWYLPEFVDIHYEQTKNFNFTEKLLQKFIKNVIEKKEQIDFEIIEKNIATILINGYEIDNPFQQKTKDVKICLSLSKISEETKANIENIISNKLHCDTIHHHSHVNVFHSFLKNYYYSNQNYVLIDIGGEITEMAIVRNSFLKTYLTIPIGSHLFVREFSKKINHDLHSTFSHLDLLVKDGLKPGVRRKLQNIFESIYDQYLEIIKNTLTNQKITNFPNKFYIFCDQKNTEIFKKVFENPDCYYGVFKISRKPEIVVFDRNSFRKIVKYKNEREQDNLVSIFSNFVTIWDKFNIKK
jgi:hypothetical protein